MAPIDADEIAVLGDMLELGPDHVRHATDEARQPHADRHRAPVGHADAHCDRYADATLTLAALPIVKAGYDPAKGSDFLIAGSRLPEECLSILEGADRELIRTVPESSTANTIPLPLTPVQLLAVDMGTDSLTALGLGVERPNPQVMRRPPRPQAPRLRRQPGRRRVDRATVPAMNEEHHDGSAPGEVDEAAIHVGRRTPLSQASSDRRR